MNAVLETTSEAELDAAVDLLVRNKQKWAQTSTEVRIQMLAEIKDRLQDVAEEWAQIASWNKRIPSGSPLEGEEWISGPYTVMSACNGLIHTLSQMKDKAFLDDLPTRSVGNEQLAVRVLPHSVWDHLLLSGIKADVWMEPGVSDANLRESVANAYDVPENEREGWLSLVLGAGNIAAIAPLDCFQKLFSEHSVVLLKMNPVNDYLIDVLESALAPLIEFGALRIVRGDSNVGEYLCKHPDIDNIHITGAGSSHYAIVWGSGSQGIENKQRGTPRNSKAITSELGAVCPTIVVPGPWIDADLRFQAEQIATQKLHNSGFNCIACQMLVMPEQWDQRELFLAQTKYAIAAAPQRGLYYPGTQQRLDEFAEQYPDAENLARTDTDTARIVAMISRSDNKHYAEVSEVFAPVLGVTSVDGIDAEAYLRNAIAYCNENLHGTLGANIIIHPKTRRALGEKWDGIIRELKYGCIAINAWTGLGFLTVQTPWGAFPGHTLDDVQSGIGFVHNTYMFDRVERTVIEAPFRPFPRNLMHGSFTLLPKPPWFVTNKKADVLGRRLTRFQHKPGFLKIPGIFLNALLG
jgi:acyl-CoA reductase-like NAD-dependent aldehyde dehydrogenase